MAIMVFKMRLNRHNGMALYHWVCDKYRAIHLILKLIISYLFMLNVNNNNNNNNNKFIDVLKVQKAYHKYRKTYYKYNVQMIQKLG